MMTLIIAPVTRLWLKTGASTTSTRAHAGATVFSRHVYLFVTSLQTHIDVDGKDRS